MTTRNRSEGWTHAKISGHKNEDLIKAKLLSDTKFQSKFAAEVKIDSQILSIDGGGKNEKLVSDVFGGKTKSKTDATILWKNNNISKLSIKKSDGGQVYLIGVDRFIKGFEKQFNKKIEPDIVRAFNLFFGGAEDVLNVIASIDRSGMKPSIKKYELRKKRLTWQSLSKYDKNLSDKFIDWFKNNIKNICIFCFSKGLSVDSNDWSDYIWYRNEVMENISDAIFLINDIALGCEKLNSKNDIKAGTRGGGTTINLPFGFVQWHQSKMQFHHQKNKILEVI